MLLTIVLALPMAIACIVYSRKYLARKYYRIPDEEGNIVEQPFHEPDYKIAATIGILIFVVMAAINLIVYNMIPSVKNEEDFQ